MTPCVLNHALTRSLQGTQSRIREGERERGGGEGERERD